PIMVKVVMNTATEVTDAPLLRRDAANGKEIKEGMCKNAPNNATINTPLKPASSPTTSEIRLCGTRPKSRPMKIIIMRTVGRIWKNDFNATVSACFVFVLSLIIANIKQPKAKTFINMAVVFMVYPFLHLNLN
ncbi:MAG: hypothetical protein N2V73_06975, partial [Candidatus Methanospirare jalkutatii]|nr:hypothetical protein [Candidatus Methanospirare jalkutatii]